MLVTSVCNQKRLPAYKSLWGNDPFYSSADLSPHARFITPQCGRLIKGDVFQRNSDFFFRVVRILADLKSSDGLKSKDEKVTSPLFMAVSRSNPMRLYHLPDLDALPSLGSRPSPVQCSQIDR